MTPSPIPEDSAAALAFLLSAAQERLLIESAGIFWLWAELLILFAVREGKHQLAHEAPRPWVVQLLFWMGLVAIPSALILLRGFMAMRAIHPDSIASPEIAAGLYIAQTQQHLLVWSAFVFAWVLLESLIVFQGWGAYRHFSRLCHDHLKRVAVAATIALLMVTASATYATDTHGPYMAALQGADATLQPYRNAVYLYLCIAGVIWIAVEWIAAVYLWRGQSLLWRSVKAARHG